MPVEISSPQFKIGFSAETGGSVTHLKFFNGTDFVDIFRPANPMAIAANDPLSMGNFPLFPFSNRIAEGRFTVDNKEHVLPTNMPPEPHSIHGISWQRPAILIEQSKTYIKISHNQNSDDYPFQFAATQEWRILNDHEIEIYLRLTNTGNHIMPFGMGIHPYFVRTPKATIKAKTDNVILNDDRMIPVSVSKIPEQFNFNSARIVNDMQMDNCFTGWNGECTLSWAEFNTELTLKADKIFGNLVVYIPEGQDFYCLEPVSNINDAVNNSLSLSNTGLVYLKPSESMDGKILLSFKTF